MNAFKKLILPMVAVVMFFSSCKDDDPVAPAAPYGYVNVENR